MSGSIQVIYGPMFSGKSSELLRKVRRYEFAKKKCVVVNYLQDHRYTDNEMMATHDKQFHKAIQTDNLLELKDEFQKYDVIAIDQGQFFIQIVQICEELANDGKIVLVAALDGTFQRKAFKNILGLLPIAQKVSKLSAICVFCSSEASFTLRTIQVQEIELIGGQESYKPVCRGCYKRQSNRMKEKEKEEQRNGLEQGTNDG